MVIEYLNKGELVVLEVEKMTTADKAKLKKEKPSLANKILKIKNK